MDQSTLWDKIWEGKSDLFFDTSDSTSLRIFHTLNNELNGFKGKKTLEMGSGSGRISLLIARSGGKPTLLDISSTAIQISKTLFEKNDMTSHISNGSILNAPFKPKTFDLVWNSGVLEHYKKDDQVRALKEMIAVCKEDGYVITFVPYSGAIFYRIAKFYDEKRNRWPYGYEKSIKSMRGLADICGLKLVKEYPIAFRAQLEYFLSRFYIEKFVKLVFRIFGDLEYTKFLRFLGGYLLVSVCKVKPNGERKSV